MKSRMEEAVRRYELLFSLPNSIIIVLATIALGLALGLTFKNPLLGIAIFSLPAYISAILSIIIGPRSLLTLKRGLGIAIVALTFQGCFYVAGWLTLKSLNPGFETYQTIVSGALFTSFSTSILFWFTVRYVKAFIPPTMAQGFNAALISKLLNLEPLAVIMILLLTQTIALIITYVGSLYINRSTFKPSEPDVLRLFNSFLHVWMAGDPRPLESELIKVSSPETVSVITVIFKSGNEVKGTFVTNDSHPGPFRNVGGSELPSLIARKLDEEIGGLTMPFHSTATHNQDPVSRSEAEKVVEATLRAAKEAIKLEKLYISPYICITDPDPQVCCQILGIPIFAVTWTSQRAQDLDVEVGRAIRQKVRSINFKDAMIIEAHNSYLPELKPLELTQTIVERAVKVLDVAKKRLVSSKLRAAFTCIKDPTFTKEKGFGEAGVRLALIEAYGETSLYVLIDGNNLEPRLRWKLKNELIKQGFNTCEIYTTDNHSIVALKPMKRGYKIIGEDIDHNLLISKISNAAKQLKERLVEVQVKVGNSEVKIRTIGEKSLEHLLEILGTGFDKARIALPTIYLSTAILSQIFTIFLI